MGNVDNMDRLLAAMTKPSWCKWIQALPIGRNPDEKRVSQMKGNVMSRPKAPLATSSSSLGEESQAYAAKIVSLTLIPTPTGALLRRSDRVCNWADCPI